MTVNSPSVSIPTMQPTPYKMLIKRILFFSFPLMLTNLLQVLFNMVDVAVIGRFSGTVSLGAVGSTSVALTIFTGFLIGMSGAVNALTARAIGAANRPLIRRTVHSALIISLTVGCIILIFGIFGSRPLLALLDTKPELIDKATSYMQIYFLGMPALAVYNFGNAVYSASGNTKRPLFFLSASGIVNVGLNLIFVIFLSLDVVGVALATVISMYLAAFLVLISLFREKGDHSLSAKELRLSMAEARSILSLGIPSGMQNAIFYIANLFVQWGVNSFDANMVAGNSASSNVDSIVYSTLDAIYVTTGSFVGRSFGALNKSDVKRSYTVTQVYSFTVAAVVGILFYVFGRPFLSLFTTDSAVIEAGMEKMSIMCFIYSISTFMDNSIAGSRALGKSIVPTVAVLMGSCVFRIVWIYTVFAHFRTIPSLYLLYAFSWGITAIFVLSYFIRTYRRIKIPPLAPSPKTD